MTAQTKLPHRTSIRTAGQTFLLALIAFVALCASAVPARAGDCEVKFLSDQDHRMDEDTKWQSFKHSRFPVGVKATYEGSNFWETMQAQFEGWDYLAQLAASNYTYGLVSGPEGDIADFNWNDFLSSVQFHGHCAGTLVVLYVDKEYSGQVVHVRPPTGMIDGSYIVNTGGQHWPDQSEPLAKGLYFSSFEIFYGQDTDYIDGDWYVQNHPELGLSDAWAAKRHIRDYGMAEGRQMHPNFDIASYLVRHSELDGLYHAAGYLHWLQVGRDAGWDATPLQGFARDIAIGADGSVFGIGVRGTIWELSDVGFERLTAGLGTRIAVSADGIPWVVGTDNSVWRYDLNAGGFVQCPGPGDMRDIAFGADNSVFGLDTDNRVWKWNPAAYEFELFDESIEGDNSGQVGDFELFDFSRGARIAVSADGIPWIVADDNTVWRYAANAGGFVQCPGPGDMRDIAFGADNSVFGIDMDNFVWKWNPAANGFERFSYGQGEHIAVDPYGNPWLVANGSTRRYDPNAGGFLITTETDGGAPEPTLLQDISIGANGTTFGIDLNNSIWYWDGSKWESTDGMGEHIAVDPEGTPWVLADDNTIWYGADIEIPGLLRDIAIGAEGSVFGIGMDNAVWKFNPNSLKFDQFSTQHGEHIAVAADGTPWIVASDNTVYRLDWATGFVEVPGLLLDIAIGADGSVFGIGMENTIWRYNGESFDLFSDFKATAITFSPTGVLWAVGLSGTPYRLDGQHFVVAQ